MKNLIFLLSLTTLISCSDDKQTETEIKTDPTTEVQQTLVESSVTTEFTKYPTVLQMLRESYDFTEEEGTLKILSKKDKPLHIQVSKLIFDGDLEKVIKEQTMRDIVYVAFQAFGQTDIDALTISSVPLKGKGNYVDKYKLSLTVSRDKAQNILKKYLNTEDFQILFRLEGTIWVPSENFDVLKFKNLDSVFAELKN